MAARNGDKQHVNDPPRQEIHKDESPSVDYRSLHLRGRLFSFWRDSQMGAAGLFRSQAARVQPLSQQGDILSLSVHCLYSVSRSMETSLRCPRCCRLLARLLRS